jgi:hypothetical protein
MLKKGTNWRDPQAFMKMVPVNGYSVETHMNGNSHPNHENRPLYDGPRLRASPGHGGTGRLFKIFVTDPPRGRRRCS